MHLALPELQAVPPFLPLNIERGTAKVVSTSTSPADALAQACTGPDYPTGNPLNPQPVTHPGDISASNYLDDRSDAVEVLSSLFNAVNRKEYVRAYSYWETSGGNSQAGPFDAFQQGYADTASVKLSTGKVTSGAGAGQRYYSVPVVLQAQTTSGGTQTFAGCYQLHLASPQIQATPPFQPLAIQSASLKPVAAGADLNALLNQSCAP